MELQKIEMERPQIIIPASQLQSDMQNNILNQQSQKSIIRTQRSLHHISSSNIQNNKSKLIPAGQYVVSYNFQNQSESKFRIHNLLVGFGQQNQSKVNTKNKLKKIKERQSQQNFNDITNTTNMASTKPHSFQTNFLYSKSFDKNQTQSKNYLSTFHYKKLPSTVISGSSAIKKVPKIGNGSNIYQKQNFPTKSLQKFNFKSNVRQNIPTSNKMNSDYLKGQTGNKSMNGFRNNVQNDMQMQTQNQFFQLENQRQKMNEFQTRNNKIRNDVNQQNQQKLSKYLSESDFNENLHKNLKEKNQNNKQKGKQGYYRNQKTDQSCSFLMPEGYQNRENYKKDINNSSFDKKMNRSPSPYTNHNQNQANHKQSAQNRQKYNGNSANWNSSSSPINKFGYFNELGNQNKFQSSSSSTSIPKRKLHPLIKRSPQTFQQQSNYHRNSNKNSDHFFDQFHQIDSDADQNIQSQKIVNQSNPKKHRENQNKYKNSQNKGKMFDLQDNFNLYAKNENNQFLNKFKKNKFENNNHNQDSSKNIYNKNHNNFQKQARLHQQNQQNEQFQIYLKRVYNIDKSYQQTQYRLKSNNDPLKSKRSKNYQQNYRQFLRLKSQQNQKKRQEELQNLDEPLLKTTRFKSIQQQNAHVQRIINPLQRSFLEDRRKKLSLERQKKRIKSLQDSKDGSNQEDFIRGDSLNNKSKKSRENTLKQNNIKNNKKNHNIFNENAQKRHKLKDRKYKVNTFNQRGLNDLNDNSSQQEIKQNIFKKSSFKQGKKYKQEKNKIVKKVAGTDDNNQDDNQKIEGMKIPQQAIKKKNSQKYGSSYDNNLKGKSSKNDINSRNTNNVKKQSGQGGNSINNMKKTQIEKDKLSKTKTKINKIDQNLQKNENDKTQTINNKKFLSSQKKQARQKLINQKQWKESMRNKRQKEKQKNINVKDRQYKNKNWKQSQNKNNKKDKSKQHQVKFQQNNKQKKLNAQKQNDKKQKQNKKSSQSVKKKKQLNQNYQNQLSQNSSLNLSHKENNQQDDEIFSENDKEMVQQKRILATPQNNNIQGQKQSNNLSDQNKRNGSSHQNKKLASQQTLNNKSQPLNQNQKKPNTQLKQKQKSQPVHENQKSMAFRQRQKQKNESLHQKNSIDLQGQILNKTHDNAQQQEQKQLINNILNSSQMNQHGIFQVSSSKAIIQNQRFLQQQQKQIKKVYGSNIHIFDQIKQNSQSMVYENYDRAPILQWIFQLPQEFKLEDSNFKNSLKKHTFFETYMSNSITMQKILSHQLKRVIKNQNVFKALQIITNMDQWMLMRILQPFMTENQQLGIWLYCLGVWRIVFIQQKQLNEIFDKCQNKEIFKEFSFKAFIWQIVESGIQKACKQYYKENLMDIQLQELVRMISGLRITKLKSSSKALKQLAYSHKKHLTIVAIPSQSTELSKWNNGYIFITRIQFTPTGEKVYQIKSFRKQDMKIKYYWIKQDKLLHTFSNFLVINKRFASYWTNRILQIEGNQKGIFCLNAQHTTCGSITVYYDKINDSKSQLCLYKQIQPEVLKLVGRLSSPKSNMTSYNTNMYFDFSLKGTYYLFLQTPSKANLSIQATSDKLQIQFIQSVKTQTMKNQQCEYVQIDKMFANQKLKKWISQQKKVKMQEIIDL